MNKFHKKKLLPDDVTVREEEAHYCSFLFTFPRKNKETAPSSGLPKNRKDKEIFLTATGLLQPGAFHHLYCVSMLIQREKNGCLSQTARSLKVNACTTPLNSLA